MNTEYQSKRELKARHTLACRMRLLRFQRRWSQENLAWEAELNRTYIGAIEREERNPGLDNVEKIARAFGIPVRELLDERLVDRLIAPDRVEEPRGIYGCRLHLVREAA